MKLVTMKMSGNRLLDLLDGLLTAVIITGSKADHQHCILFFHPFRPVPSFLIP